MLILILAQLVVALLAVWAGAELWHIGGQGQKWARKWAFPIMLGLVKVFMDLPNFSFWNLLYIPALMGLTSLFSYGKESKIHDFLEWLFGKGEDGKWHLMEVMTRAICGFLWAQAGWFFVLGGGRIETQALYIVFLTAANGLIGGLAHNVSFSEKSVGASVSCSLFV
jgi:hypothetical protein